MVQSLNKSTQNDFRSRKILYKPKEKRSDRSFEKIVKLIQSFANVISILCACHICRLPGRRTFSWATTFRSRASSAPRSPRRPRIASEPSASPLNRFRFYVFFYQGIFVIWHLGYQASTAPTRDIFLFFITLVFFEISLSWTTKVFQVLQVLGVGGAGVGIYPPAASQKEVKCPLYLDWTATKSDSGYFTQVLNVLIPTLIFFLIFIIFVLCLE